jgi:hypothetical protein
MTASFHANSSFSYVSSYSHLTLIDQVKTTAVHAPQIQNQAAHAQGKHKALCRSHCKSQTTTSNMCLVLPTMGSPWHPLTSVTSRARSQYPVRSMKNNRPHSFAKTRTSTDRVSAVHNWRHSTVAMATRRPLTVVNGLVVAKGGPQTRST